MTEQDLTISAEPLLKRAGLKGPFQLISLKGGANNQVFEARGGNGSVILKHYFKHAQDKRDRLGTEFGFCTFAWSQGLRCVARPLLMDTALRIALYEFVQGSPIKPGDVHETEIEQAAHFFTALNAHRDHPDAAALPMASEACFSIPEHLHLVAGRVQHLEMLMGGSSIDGKASDFVQTELKPAWQRVSTFVRAKTSPDAAEPLPQTDRRLSPSDFGFHNALRAADGSLRFFDFEYAGWDDPAKTACDFFSQVAVPAPMDLLDYFAGEIVRDQRRPVVARARIRLLLPIYQLKWCCIILNDFLPTGAARRAFASSGGIEEGKRGQLQKAIALLGQIKEGGWAT